MLEIEHEKMENERRAKDQKIMILENKAQQLNEKLLILKSYFTKSSNSTLRLVARPAGVILSVMGWVSP